MKAILLAGSLLMCVLTTTIASAQTHRPQPAPVIHHNTHHTRLTHHEIARSAAQQKRAHLSRNEHPVMHHSIPGGYVKRSDGYARDIY